MGLYGDKYKLGKFLALRPCISLKYKFKDSIKIMKANSKKVASRRVLNLK